MYSIVALCGFLLFLGNFPALAQAVQPQPPTPSSPVEAAKDYNTIVNGFFDLLKEMKYKAAADYILNSNPTMVDNVAMHESLFTSLNQVGTAAGDFKRFAPIVDKRWGNDIAYVYGIGIYEKHLIRFEFIFAREDAGWEMESYGLSVNVTEELRALAGVVVEPPKPAAK